MKITGKSATQLGSLKDAQGKTITEESKIKSRWKEYFEGLNNDPNPKDDSALSPMTQPNTDAV